MRGQSRRFPARAQDCVHSTSELICGLGNIPYISLKTISFKDKDNICVYKE